MTVKSFSKLEIGDSVYVRLHCCKDWKVQTIRSVGKIFLCCNGYSQYRHSCVQGTEVIWQKITTLKLTFTFHILVRC